MKNLILRLIEKEKHFVRLGSGLICYRFDVKRVTQWHGENAVNEKDAAKIIFTGLKEAGIGLIATLPDINLAQLLREVEEDHDVIHVPLCREEEGIGICAGAYLVGKKCAAIMQNGGFFNSTNAIVSTLLQYQIPLLLLIYYAGDIGDRTFSTSGSMTEPVLLALGIRYYVMRESSDAPELIKRAQILAEDSRRPVALLLTKEGLGLRAALKSL
jgi:sulfopyruvate decarboxylase subunit alpha